MSGAAFQALFANPLAAPDTLGVATGASFGAVLGILWGWNGMGIQLMSLATGLSAVFFVIVISRVRNTSSILMIILSGMVVGALFSALVSLVKYAADPQDVLPSITFWMMGALTGATKSSVLAGTPMVLLGMLVLWLLRWRLNVTTLPTDEAASLGIPVRRIRAGVIIAATMITASVVSMCGLIGWVGLLVPHAARMVFGANNRFVLPASMVMGALFMLVIDTVARTATQSEIPVSILTAVVVRRSSSIFCAARAASRGSAMSLEVIHGGYAWPGREPVLTGVNFRFDGTGVMSILGPNGAGKTTLLRCMLGLLQFTEGEATLDGRPVSNWKPRDFWRTIGYVPQAKLPGFASMTLADMVVLGRSARIGPFSLPSDADWEVVDRVMTEVGIEHLARRLLSEVSGGQFELALIARALAAETQNPRARRA
ncbi:MAG: iron chelate uptake ABC transporter family permease subunit [Sutterella wadsworthensis]